jgi:hypothetical protein
MWSLAQEPEQLRSAQSVSAQPAQSPEPVLEPEQELVLELELEQVSEHEPALAQAEQSAAESVP